MEYGCGFENITMTKFCFVGRALNTLNGYGGGPASSLIGVLFGYSEPSQLQSSKAALSTYSDMPRISVILHVVIIIIISIDPM